MKITSAVELSTGLASWVIYDSPDSIAPMQTALCLQNLTPGIEKNWVESGIIKLKVKLHH